MVNVSKREHVVGKEGERLALNVLGGRGVRMAEAIGTPVRLIPIRGVKNGWYVKFGAKVSGDIMGLLKDGTRVLAEVKAIHGRNLRWSDLRTHQPGRLDHNKNYNGISLLVWVSGQGVFVMDWVFPNEDFGPGIGLTVEEADKYDLMDVNELRIRND